MISAPTERRDKALTDWGILERLRECRDTNYAMLLQANQPNLGASAEQSNLWLSWVAKFSAQCCACLSLFKILFSKQRKVYYRKKSHIFSSNFHQHFWHMKTQTSHVTIFFFKKTNNYTISVDNSNKQNHQSICVTCRAWRFFWVALLPY